MQLLNINNISRLHHISLAQMFTLEFLEKMQVALNIKSSRRWSKITIQQQQLLAIMSTKKICFTANFLQRGNIFTIINLMLKANIWEGGWSKKCFTVEAVVVLTASPLNHLSWWKERDIVTGAREVFFESSQIYRNDFFYTVQQNCIDSRFLC